MRMRALLFLIGLFSAIVFFYPSFADAQGERHITVQPTKVLLIVYDETLSPEIFSSYRVVKSNNGA